MTRTKGNRNLSSFEIGQINALQAVGLDRTKIAEILDRSVKTITKVVSNLDADNADVTTKILASADPIAAVVMAESMASSDEHVKLKAATTHLKGRGHYSEHVKQTTRSIPDSEISAGLTEMLMAALSSSAIEADYTVSDNSNPVDQSSDTPETRTATSGGSPDIVHGSQAAYKEGSNNGETADEQRPTTRPTDAEQVRNSGETLGKLIARENAKRFTQSADQPDSITGATSTSDDTRDERA